MSLAWFLQFDYDSSAPPEQAWRRRLNSHANLLKEFRVTFMEAIKMASDFSLSQTNNWQQGFTDLIDGNPLCIHINYKDSFIIILLIIFKFMSLSLLIVYCVLKFQVRLGIRIWSYVREEASHGRVDFKFYFIFWSFIALCVGTLD